MSARRRSAHGTISGEVVTGKSYTPLNAAIEEQKAKPVSFVKVTTEERAPHWTDTEQPWEFRAHIAPPAIYADLCRKFGFDPSAEADERRRGEEFDRRMNLPAGQW